MLRIKDVADKVVADKGLWFKRRLKASPEKLFGEHGRRVGRTWRPDSIVVEFC